MSTFRGTIECLYEEKQFEWKISNFFSKVRAYRRVEYVSPAFPSAGAYWILMLSLTYSRHRKWSLYLKYRDGPDKMNVKFEFGFRKVDGTVKQFCLAYDCLKFGEKYSICDWKDLELSRLKHSLDLNGCLVITCILKQESNKLLCRKNGSAGILEKYDNLSKNFKKMLNDEDTCDVILHVDNQTFKAHKFVLMARSPVFAAMFHHDSLEKQTGVINIPDCDSNSFGHFLEFLYCGKLEKLSFNTALNLYCTSEKYDIQELKMFCVGFMKFNLTEDNLCDALDIADKYSDEKFLLAAQDFFNNNAHKIVITSKWHTFFQNNFKLANRLISDMVSKIDIPDNLKIRF